jgi:hypothetical protein
MSSSAFFPHIFLGSGGMGMENDNRFFPAIRVRDTADTGEGGAKQTLSR